MLQYYLFEIGFVSVRLVSISFFLLKDSLALKKAVFALGFETAFFSKLFFGSVLPINFQK